MTGRPPFPPFTPATARQKVQAAEDAWNTRDPERVALAYTEDSVWRNRDTFVTGRSEIAKFLAGKWERELEYALRKRPPDLRPAARAGAGPGLPAGMTM
jgi:uncharacterized protein (TIGR02246 family)